MKNVGFLILMLSIIAVGLAMADDYVDDIYYSSKDASREQIGFKPNYKHGIKEIIFIEPDSILTDTMVVDSIIKLK